MMTALSQPAAAPQREQTMEEILASIRKIIETNEAMAIQAEAVQAAQPVQAPAEISPTAVMTLTEAVARDVPMATSLHMSAIDRAVADRLVSETPEKRVAAAFDDLNLAFMRSKQKPLEEVAETMLRPMLQDWLDNNLPTMVERLVREEIARIARGDI
jgi:uncharacterized protein